MANAKNLVPFTSEKAKEAGRKGGYACAKARRERQKVAEVLKSCMGARIGEGEIRQKLAAAGIELDKDATHAMALAAGLLLQAIQGNTQAAKLVLEMTGEEPELQYRKSHDRALLKFRKEQMEKVAGLAGDSEVTITITPPSEGD